MRRALLLLLSLAACYGDHSDQPQTPCGPDGPQVQIITADGTRAARVDGDSIALVHGAQGGWHIEVGARVSDTTQRVALDLEVSRDELRLAHGRFEVALSDYDDLNCAGYRDNMLGIFRWTLLPNPDDLTPDQLLDGMLVDVTVTATTDAGSRSQQVELRVVWD